jgi:hypothetical protein
MMKLTIEPTSTMTNINGVPARVWKGTSDKGVAVQCFIAFVQVHMVADNTEFERELREVTDKITRELVSFDYRMAMD